MTSATAADYGWIRSSSSLFKYALEIGYTLTLVRGSRRRSCSEWRGPSHEMCALGSTN